MFDSNIFSGRRFPLLPAPLISLLLVSSAPMLAGCSAFGASGPSTGRVLKAGESTAVDGSQIQVVNVDEATARRVSLGNSTKTFAEVFGKAAPVGSQIGPGDVVQISIWEAPPAVLLGSSVVDSRITAGAASGALTLPEQMVDQSGAVTLPYVGRVMVAGRIQSQVERDIVQRLEGKAHKPQAIVRVTKNATANVTVMGDVPSSARVPLTPKGERLLDVLAAVGGAKQAVSKSTVQITRGNTVLTMPLQRVAQQPEQNIVMQSNDVVNVMFQPYSFTALGAVSSNAEVPFEGTGITLAQALGRMGGLRDDRADIRGIFIFRLEDPALLSSDLATTARTTLDGKVPVIYRLDLRDPAGFFIAQGFPILNHDVVYVSNAPAADLQKFVNMVSSMTFSVVGVTSL